MTRETDKEKIEAMLGPAGLVFTLRFDNKIWVEASNNDIAELRFDSKGALKGLVIIYDHR